VFNNVDVQYVRGIQVLPPAAGAEFSVTAPGQGTWRVVALSAVLTASAAVANRLPALTWNTSDGMVASSPATAAVTAALSTRFSALAGAIGAGVAAGPQLWATPTDGFVLLPGHSLASVTAGLDAADQWSAIRLLVVEYPTGPNIRLTPDVASFLEPAR
jgi:hypothetical protein